MPPNLYPSDPQTPSAKYCNDGEFRFISFLNEFVCFSRRKSLSMVCSDCYTQGTLWYHPGGDSEGQSTGILTGATSGEAPVGKRGGVNGMMSSPQKINCQKPPMGGMLVG